MSNGESEASQAVRPADAAVIGDADAKQSDSGAIPERVTRWLKRLSLRRRLWLIAVAGVVPVAAIAVSMIVRVDARVHLVVRATSVEVTAAQDAILDLSEVHAQRIDIEGISDARVDGTLYEEIEALMMLGGQRSETSIGPTLQQLPIRAGTKFYCAAVRDQIQLKLLDPTAREFVAAYSGPVGIRYVAGGTTAGRRLTAERSVSVRTNDSFLDLYLSPAVGSKYIVNAPVPIAALEFSQVDLRSREGDVLHQRSSAVDSGKVTFPGYGTKHANLHHGDSIVFDGVDGEVRKIARGTAGTLSLEFDFDAEDVRLGALGSEESISPTLFDCLKQHPIVAAMVLAVPLIGWILKTFL